MRWLLLLFICTGSYAQNYTYNLVKDPGFEDKRFCPNTYTTNGGTIPLNQWYNPTSGTPDLFSGCSIMDSGVPTNWAGSANTREGNNYIGLYIGGSNYREFVGTELLQPLQKNVVYSVRFFLKPATYTRFSIDSLTIGFHDEKLSMEEDGIPNAQFLVRAGITGPDNNDPKRWQMVEISYKATGEERYFILGDFTPTDPQRLRTRFEGPPKNSMIGNSAYYFFDYVEILSPSHKLAFPIGEYFTLDNLYFDFDSYIIDGEGRENLIALTEFLATHQELTLTIRGHTDEKGSVAYNLRLSQERINSVLEIMTEWGLPKKRIKQLAYGEQLPVSEVDEKNRRIEFRLSVK